MMHTQPIDSCSECARIAELAAAVATADVRGIPSVSPSSSSDVTMLDMPSTTMIDSRLAKYADRYATVT